MGVFSRATGTYDPKTQSFPIEDIRSQILDLVHLWPHAPAADQAILAEPADANGARFFYMRLWHDAPTADQIEIAVSDDPEGPALGDTGVVPVFRADGRAGDFWVATLRTDAPAQVQPFDLLRADGVPPHGPRHFFAPLALLAAEVDALDPIALVTEVRDCRPRLRPLTERCPTLTVGDGVHSFGDFTTIAEALQNLPDEGGIISVRPGVYAPPVTLVNRKNITIEGCGDATIIESQFGQGPGVIFITNSKDIHISSLRIHAGEEPGVIVQNGSQNVTLDALHIISGTLSSGRFLPGGTAPFPQVHITNGAGGSLNNLRLEPNRQVGLRVESTSGGVSITGLHAQGFTGNDDGFATPLVEFRFMSGVSLVESTLIGFGQVPLLVHSMNGCLLSDLSVSSRERASPSSFATNLYPAVQIFQVNDAVLRRSALQMENRPSMHAVLTIHGGPMRIEHNEIVAEGGGTANAWGGIQVLGGSRGIRIVGNRIANGYGHGITLGSVSWTSGVETRFSQEGAGQGQTEGSEGAFSATGLIQGFREGDRDFSPSTDGDIVTLAITDNLITQMGTNGISALTVAGLGDPFILFSVFDVQIERNTIRTNLLRPSSSIPDVFTLPFPTAREGSFLTMSVLPFGGIVLATADAVDIRDNIIVSNGTVSGVLPMNGIFVLTGDSLTIESNRIQDNGGRALDEAVPVRAGVRAGIAVMLAGAGAPGSEEAIDEVLAGLSTLDNSGVALRICGNTVSHPEGRALHAVGIGPFQIEGNFFSALGNQGGDEIAEQFAIGELIYVQNLGGPWERFELGQFQPNPAPFTAFPTRAFETLLDTVATSPRQYLGGGGQIQFNNNHTVFDWSVFRIPTQGAPLSYFPVVLLTLDHLGMLGNHLALRAQGNALAGLPLPHPNEPGDAEAFQQGFAFEPILSHILAAGVTLNVQLNRISENVRASYLSLLANADLLNYTAYNQTTHDVLSLRTQRLDTNPAYEKFTPTQVIYHVSPGLDASATPPPPSGDGRVRERLRVFMRTFLQLTFAFQR
jgi:hypothetical protein